MSAPTISKPAAVELTIQELQLLLAFRAMDARGQRESLSSAIRDAEDYPRRARPRLQLVGGVQ